MALGAVLPEFIDSNLNSSLSLALHSRDKVINMNSLAKSVALARALPSASGAARRAMADGASASKAKAGGSSIVQRLTAFSVGVAAASAFYYVQLHQDIWDSTVKIEKALSEVKLEAIHEIESLRHTVAVLEKEVDILKSKA